jgi:hypothetical protein
MPKVEIHFEISVSSEPAGVNQVIALFQQTRARIVPTMVAGYLAATQDLALQEVLGAKWTGEPQGQTPRVCPLRQSREGFRRRASRSRTLRKSSLGNVPFALRQATCDQCQSTFSPFPKSLGL